MFIKNWGYNLVHCYRDCCGSGLPGKPRNYKLLSPAMRGINIGNMLISLLCPGSLGAGVSIGWYITRPKSFLVAK